LAGVGAMAGAALGSGFAGAGAGAPCRLDAGAVAAKAATARTARRMAERAEREADIVVARGAGLCDERRRGWQSWRRWFVP
jgi:hypothetical protein